jgi:hypothetical protein
VAPHERFGKRFGAFELCRRFGGPEDAHAMGTELVHDAGRQRAFRPHHGQTDLVVLRPFAQLHHVGDGQVLQPRV